MSFLRTRLSRVFGGFDGTQDTNTESLPNQRATSKGSSHQTHHHSPSTLGRTCATKRSLLDLVKDQVYSNHRSSEQATPTTQATRRNRARSMNQTASTRIKDLSESIRASTNLFYALPNASTNSKTSIQSSASLSPKHSQRSEARSSLRSRRSWHSKLDDPQEFPNRFLTLNSSERRVSSHEIDVSIPTSGLLDEPSLSKLKITTNSPPVSPAHVVQNSADHRKETSQNENMKGRLLADRQGRSPISGTESLRMGPITANASWLPQNIPERNSSRRERCDSVSSDSSRSSTSFDSRLSSLLALPLELDSLLSFVDSKQSSRHGSLFVKGSHDEHVYTISPYRKAMQDLKTRPLENTCLTATRTAAGELPLLPSRSSGVQGKENSMQRRNDSPEPTLYPDAPSESRSHIEYLSQDRGTKSTGYHASVELSGGESATLRSSLGAERDETRTDRKRQARAVHAIDAETESDTETDVGLRLRHCQTSPVDPSWSMKSIAVTPATQRTLERRAKDNSPGSERKVSRFLVHSITHTPVDSSTILQKKPSHDVLPSEAIKYAVEAINKINGYVLEFPDSLRAAIEAIERPSVASMSSPLSLALKQPAVDQVPALALAGYDTLAASAVRAAAVETPPLRLSFSEDITEGVSDLEVTAELSNDLSQKASEAESKSKAPKLPLETDLLRTRCPSSQSATTTNSCAAITNDPRCCSPILVPSVHHRKSPVHRTSSVNDKIREALGDAHDEIDVVSLVPHRYTKSFHGSLLEAYPASPIRNQVPPAAPSRASSLGTDGCAQPATGQVVGQPEISAADQMRLSGAESSLKAPTKDALANDVDTHKDLSSLSRSSSNMKEDITRPRGCECPYFSDAPTSEHIEYADELELELRGETCFDQYSKFDVDSGSPASSRIPSLRRTASQRDAGDDFARSLALILAQEGSTQQQQLRKFLDSHRPGQLLELADRLKPEQVSKIFDIFEIERLSDLYDKNELEQLSKIVDKPDPSNSSLPNVCTTLPTADDVESIPRLPQGLDEKSDSELLPPVASLHLRLSGAHIAGMSDVELKFCTRPASTVSPASSPRGTSPISMSREGSTGPQDQTCHELAQPTHATSSTLVKPTMQALSNPSLEGARPSKRLKCMEPLGDPYYAFITSPSVRTYISNNSPYSSMTTADSEAASDGNQVLPSLPPTNLCTTHDSARINPSPNVTKEASLFAGREFKWSDIGGLQRHLQACKVSPYPQNGYMDLEPISELGIRLITEANDCKDAGIERAPLDTLSASRLSVEMQRTGLLQNKPNDAERDFEERAFVAARLPRFGPSSSLPHPASLPGPCDTSSTNSEWPSWADDKPGTVQSALLYEKVGTPKLKEFFFVTSSMKKGVWWQRDGECLQTDANSPKSSPLAYKAPFVTDDPSDNESAEMADVGDGAPTTKGDSDTMEGICSFDKDKTLSVPAKTILSLPPPTLSQPSAGNRSARTPVPHSSIPRPTSRAQSGLSMTSPSPTKKTNSVVRNSHGPHTPSPSKAKGKQGASTPESTNSKRGKGKGVRKGGKQDGAKEVKWSPIKGKRF